MGQAKAWTPTTSSTGHRVAPRTSLLRSAMPRVAAAGAMCLVALLCGELRAQFLADRGLPELEFAGPVRLDEADHVARANLERFDRFLASGQWDEAVETLLSVIDEAGDAVVPVTGTRAPGDDVFARFVTLRVYCQMRLAGLYHSAPELLQAYRQRVDPLAEQWYRQGIEERDADRLRSVADRFFVSSWADDALLQWGELELQRGHFAIARAAWERIGFGTRIPEDPRDWLVGLPGSPLWSALDENTIEEHAEELHRLLLGEERGSRSWLTYPDPDVDPAEVHARLALVSLLEGSTERAAIETSLVKVLFPDAEGTIAGETSRYGALLSRLLEQSRSWPAVAASPDWPTFGGTPRRTAICPEVVDIALRPIWSVPLPVPSMTEEGPTVFPPVSETGATLSYHPLVVGDTVLLNTGTSIDDVIGLDIHSGQPLWPLSANGMQETEPSSRTADRDEDPGLLFKRGGPGLFSGRGMPRGQWGLPRYTMTAHENRLYVKLGRQATSFPVSERFVPPAPGYLAALDLDAQKKRLFEIRLDNSDWGSDWSFEGPPLAEGGRLYVAMRRRDSLRAQAHIACFDARRGDLIWRRFIAAADTLGAGNFIEYTHNLLSYDQGMLYFNTNLGAVAAVRAQDGQLQWLLRYPRQPDGQRDPDRSMLHLYRDLNPCVVDRDRIYVAPTDSDRIFALDASTGMVLWTTTPPETSDVVHLLGVAAGRLIASGRQLTWLETRTGRVVGRFPNQADRSLCGYGRGILAGDTIYWPTPERIFVLDQSGLRQRRQPIDLQPLGLSGGNLVIAHGVLLIAGKDRLVAFDQFGTALGLLEP